MPDSAFPLLPVCGERSYLPTFLGPAALAFAPPGTSSTLDVDRDLRCVLQAHTTGDHYAFVMQIDGHDSGVVWTSWNGEHQPVSLEVRPDCPATNPRPDGGDCCQYNDHPGGHSFELTDPWDIPLAALPQNA